MILNVVNELKAGLRLDELQLFRGSALVAEGEYGWWDSNPGGQNQHIQRDKSCLMDPC